MTLQVEAGDLDWQCRLQADREMVKAILATLVTAS